MFVLRTHNHDADHPQHHRYRDTTTADHPENADATIDLRFDGGRRVREFWPVADITGRAGSGLAVVVDAGTAILVVLNGLRLVG